MGNGALKRAVFLDRDGVVNDAVVRDGRPHPPTPEQLRIAADAPEALKALHDGGFELIVVTSQPDVARGTASLDALHAIERRLRDALPLDAFYVCPHDDADRCACRKPLPGLIETAACERGIDLGGSFLIGDRWRDVAAAQAAGVTSIFLDRGYAEPRPEPPADATFGSLREAARWIVNGAAVEGVLGEAPIPDLARLRTRVFADGADLAQIVALAADPRIAGFTTNPTLMRKAGVRDYAAFARAVLEVVGERPISFEVFADDEPEMERQARAIACWGANVYVKIPVTDTTGVSTMPLVRRLSAGGVRLNVTALMTTAQVRDVTTALTGGAPAFVSVFAGRIADTGRDPLPILRESLRIMAAEPQLQLIWASPRELLNLFQADEIGCHVITVTNDILAKLGIVGKDLDAYSLETVKMFHGDAAASGFTI
ncbi:MAG TPA: transaldolase [Candidatus Baltobacteraceae bacterium]|nr:transaldolase [Candidatus Baltobacteraceae bacterium]